jgi:TetR/AcrR family transcriptional regulator, regulator of cefoperazone and chloramphenicol sensitivity
MTLAAAPSPVKIPPSHETRKQRTDGAEARQQLLHAALGLFAEKGFAKTSTREIALAAGANIAAISYYFGDKAGLYRAAFTEPMGCVRDDTALFDQPDFSLRQSLQGFISSFLAPMKRGELVQQCLRLHFREMLEPTGLWAEEIDSGIKPAHAALVALLGRHLGVKQADDGLHRLAFSIAGLALQLFVTRDVVRAIRPQLVDQPDAVDAWSEQLVLYAEAMVAVEAAQRASAHSASGPIDQTEDLKDQPA